MVYCILFFLGAIALGIGIKIDNEVHRLALTSAALLPIGWGYFSSPVLFQCLSGIAIIGASQIYISSN